MAIRKAGGPRLKGASHCGARGKILTPDFIIYDDYLRKVRAMAKKLDVPGSTHDE